MTVRNFINHKPFWTDPTVNPSANKKTHDELVKLQTRKALEKESNPVQTSGVRGNLSKTYESVYETTRRTAAKG